MLGHEFINNNNGPSTQIEFYNSEMTKKLDFPFSDATIVNNVIYVAGQVGNIPGTNELVPGGIRKELCNNEKHRRGFNCTWKFYGIKFSNALVCYPIYLNGVK